MAVGWADKPINMDIRFQNSPQETAGMRTEALRQQFLVQNLFVPGQVNLVYTHFDRVIIGGVCPLESPIALPNEEELKASHFLERRELGIINIGATGKVKAGGKEYELHNQECLYLGKGAKDVFFASNDPAQPALFYLLSAPAHQTYPNQKMTKEEASPVHLGDFSTSNKRTIYKYIHQDGIKSCQLVMGFTVLETGCVWNSVPPHTHTRRMEVYLYFNLDPAHRVIHVMGEPQQTRHLMVANQEAVIAPPWSMHFGVGTANYGFIWGMAGENQAFADMDQVAIASLL